MIPDEIDSLNHLEEDFYRRGHSAGYDHGKLHGVFEGRALGREKAFELWEELGFYEGQALVWQGVLASQSDEKSKKGQQHIVALLEMTGRFPLINNSSAPDDSQVDITALLKSIRSRYRIMAASIGIRPRLAAATNGL